MGLCKKKSKVLVSKKAELLEQEINFHVKFATKMYETDYEVPLGGVFVVVVCVCFFLLIVHHAPLHGTITSVA